MAVKNYSELLAWQRAMDLVESVYKVTQTFPREELYGLTSQIRRAVVSIPSNIAEGQGRGPTKEFTHHLAIAYGSLCEVQTQLLIAKRLGLINEQSFQALFELSQEVARLTNGLINSLSK
jgi:four helix bundle protein